MKKDDNIFLPQRSVSLSTVYDLEHQPSSTQAETVVHPVTDAAAPPNFCVCILMEVLSSSARTSHPHHFRGNSCTPGPRRSSLTLRPRSRKLLTIIEGSCSRSYTVPWDFYIVTMILQRIRTIVGDAEFEPGTSAPEVWCATNEPPHLQMNHHSCCWWCWPWDWVWCRWWGCRVRPAWQTSGAAPCTQQEHPEGRKKKIFFIVNGTHVNNYH